MLSKVLSLDKFSCPQIWNIEQEKDRKKEKVGGRQVFARAAASEGYLSAVIHFVYLAVVSRVPAR